VGTSVTVGPRPARDYSRLGDLSPHDLRRMAITRALGSGLTYRQVRMMSKHKDPKTVMRTGRLTRGVVKDVLTKSPLHPHGIKVRLETGEVSRVKEVVGES
jgi:uncharacterized repeat protein (TIGR03833 family)